MNQAKQPNAAQVGPKTKRIEMVHLMHSATHNPLYFKEGWEKIATPSLNFRKILI